MKSALDSITPVLPDPGMLKAGWSKVSIIPSKPVPIASYGIRKDYEGIHDSIWCKAFVFDNGKHVSAFVTLDLLIFPPAVVKKIKSRISSTGIEEKNIVFSAIHSHNSPGGWAEGLGGRLLAGPYNKEYVNQLSDAVIEAIINAKSSMSKASVGFAKFQADKVILNHLSDKKRDLDSWIRVVKIKKENGNTAALVTYAAHPNILSSKIDQVSGDYAGALVDSLESSSDIDFAAFSAGAVAGHNCKYDSIKNFKAIGYVSSYLYKKIKKGFDSIPLTDSISMTSIKIPVYLREPQLKAFKGWKIRPWIFNSLFGEQEVYVSVMKIGDMIFIGTPCDFAGDLVCDLSPDAEAKHLNLIVTSFNGGYIGYIIPDRCYDLDLREARDMDWYGPNSGSYFSFIIKSLLKKF
jgi:hypothetical protein